MWSLGFRPGGGELLTGGLDRVVRRWDMKRGEPIGPVAMARPDDFLAGFKGDRGAELFQACAACHTLTPDGGNRAGPTLHGVFGRRIATAPGYNFSMPLKALDIVWTPRRCRSSSRSGLALHARHQDAGAAIGDPADRAALVRFLEQASKSR